MAKKPRRERRRGQGNTSSHRRRRTDFYAELGKFAGLIAFVCTAIIGQAELIGEPWRHVLTVAAVICGHVWAYCMHPGNIGATLKAFRGK